MFSSSSFFPFPFLYSPHSLLFPLISEYPPSNPYSRWSSILLPRLACPSVNSPCRQFQPLCSHSLEPPESITIPDFIFSDKHARKPIAQSRNPFTCGISGKTYTTEEVIQREKLLARALAKRLGYDVHDGTEWDRVVALFSVNTVRLSSVTQNPTNV